MCVTIYYTLYFIICKLIALSLNNFVSRLYLNSKKLLLLRKIDNDDIIKYIFMKVRKKMKNKVVLITGASKGIGRNIAKSLAIEGYTIIANYNNSEKLAIELKEELKKDEIDIEIFIIHPLLLFIIFLETSCVIKNAEYTFVFIILSNSSYVISVNNLLCAIPALLTKISIFPYFSRQ